MSLRWGHSHFVVTSRLNSTIKSLPSKYALHCFCWSLTITLQNADIFHHTGVFLGSVPGKIHFVFRFKVIIDYLVIQVRADSKQHLNCILFQSNETVYSKNRETFLTIATLLQCVVIFRDQFSEDHI